ncbi:ATP-binding protein [Candidatus Methylospira mobilis]|uniref:sensor histidine kinase n=1 Tax=Candidatus Methylospira mobilis TaxID=1808979 RepID=UPI0028EFC6DD|nr:ATP-binding protein [Candidatus Methylospira mobilis]WNV06194.1 ATP-binding protein [Candidatus Methylospira mobilis]
MKLVLTHLAVILVILAFTAFGAYWMLSKAIHDQLDAALLALAETEAAMLDASGQQPIRIHETSPGLAPPSLVRLDRLLQIVNTEGTVLARSANLGASRLPTTPALLARLAAGETVFETLRTFGEEPIRMISMPVISSEKPLTIQVAGSLDDVRNVLDSASLLFIVMALGLLVAVGTVGASLTRKVFQAIDNIVKQARHIGEANLSERLPHPGTHDDIGRLVDTLNEMLNRIEQSLEVQRRFTADASHELRSPLSRLRTELEVTLRRPRDVAEYIETVRSCLEEVDRLTLLVEALLVLARLDAGQEQYPVETVFLNILVEEVVDRMQPVADARQVWIAAKPLPPLTASIARSTVSVVLTNLLDNAVKFSPPGGCVTIRIAIDGPEAVISVSDSGPGMQLDEIPQLFERFYRGAVARTNTVPGSGLGLAISQAIMRRHGGRIEAANLPDGGAVFSARMPLQKQSDY